MKKIFLSVIICLFVFLCACTAGKNEEGTSSASQEEVTFINITQEEAKNIMETEKDFVIVDARSEAEYNEGHIPGAILIPHDETEEKAPGLLEDKDKTILIYCRSGRRSKLAAGVLADMGYTDVREFGGINTWEYETEK